MVDGRAVHRPGQPDGDRGAALEFTGELHGPVLQFDKPAHQRQPDPGSFHAAAARAVRAEETFAQSFQVRRGDADTGVANHDAAVRRIAVHSDRDRALQGVLHRVGQQVEHDGFPHARIEVGHRRGGSPAPAPARPAGTARKTTTRCPTSARRHRCIPNWRWRDRLRYGRSRATNRPAAAGALHYAALYSADSPARCPGRYQTAHRRAAPATA